MEYKYNQWLKNQDKWSYINIDQFEVPTFNSSNWPNCAVFSNQQTTSKHNKSNEQTQQILGEIFKQQLTLSLLKMTDCPQFDI